MSTKALGRFAPTTSGRAHPGTLLAALLAWLDARSAGARFLLRLEDIDPTAQDRDRQRGLLDDLEWFGLTWDDLVWQSSRRASHEAALDRLASVGRLYECGCSRTAIRNFNLPSAAGGWVYPGTCRHRTVTDWRASRDNLRVNTEGVDAAVADESGLDLSQHVPTAMGDPLLRRADGGMAYQLAVVVDDAEAGVTRVVRGRDLASNTATQVVLRKLLGYDIPVYRHHLLLLEPRGDKLAKLHQSVGADMLRQWYTPARLLAFLARTAGLSAKSETSFEELLGDFSWRNVSSADTVVGWDGRHLGTPGPVR